jgi:hypothetical protein
MVVGNLFGEDRAASRGGVAAACAAAAPPSSGILMMRLYSITTNQTAIVALVAQSTMALVAEEFSCDGSSGHPGNADPS